MLTVRLQRITYEKVDKLARIQSSAVTLFRGMCVSIASVGAMTGPEGLVDANHEYVGIEQELTNLVLIVQCAGVSQVEIRQKFHNILLQRDRTG